MNALINQHAQLEEAISASSASDYDKGNILYLAEQLADAARKSELEGLLLNVESVDNRRFVDEDVIEDRIKAYD